MTQEKIWDREYQNSRFLTKENKPQADVVRFVKWLKKAKTQIKSEFTKSTESEFRDSSFEIDGKKVLDLGSGIGRNSFYFGELGSKVVGIEISQTAINIAEQNMSRMPLDIEYVKGSIGDEKVFEKFKDDYFNIILDITSSNSLTEKERGVYLNETKRILTPEGYFFVKALCKDGDENAKYLLKTNPGQEKDTYIMPQTGITERVWSREDLEETYGKYFKILNLEKKTNYSLIDGRSYKRNFWLVYMVK